jgi:hypothetical protein
MNLTMEQIRAEISVFLDDEGRIKLFPAKKKNKELILMYLSSSFECGVTYTEKEVNAIIEDRHIFQDKWLLRRELIDHGFLERLTDGSKYWKALKTNEISMP